MTNIDQFESVFRAADKGLFAREEISINRVLVVTDQTRKEAEQFAEQVRIFLSVINNPSVNWQVMTGDENRSITKMVEKISQASPDLICTYRNLHLPAAEHPHSLGAHLDVMTQATPHPVVVLPHPDDDQAKPIPPSTDPVMAITDHLTGQHHLVSFAAKFTSPGGQLLLTHVEDKTVFDRYIETIGKIPEIETDVAKRTIADQLLKEARDYIQLCRDGLREAGLDIRVEQVVTMGNRLRDYCNLIADHHVKLLVLNTKDHDQMAMHGLAYPLSVELQNTPLLLL